MTLTPRQIELVQKTFAQIAPQADEAAHLFYGYLFESNPSLRLMFKHDMREQGRKLMQMLSVAVHALDHLEDIVPAVQALGERHTGYGVKYEDYAAVGQALVWTLEQGLGEAFTPEVKEAWTSTYVALVQAATSHLPEPA
jgi:hemoglobin-like flavoprotein